MYWVGCSREMDLIRLHATDGDFCIPIRCSTYNTHLQYSYHFGTMDLETPSECDIITWKIWQGYHLRGTELS